MRSKLLSAALAVLALGIIGCNRQNTPAAQAVMPAQVPAALGTPAAGNQEPPYTNAANYSPEPPQQGYQAFRPDGSVTAAPDCNTPLPVPTYGHRGVYTSDLRHYRSRPVVIRQVSERQIMTDGGYRPRTVVTNNRSFKKSAEVVGGSAAVGAAIGALAGGGKGAGIGALAAGAGGFIYDRATAHRRVTY